MKLTGLLLMISILHVSAGVTAQQHLSISVRNFPLERLFNLIEQKTGYTVFYNMEVLRNSKPVTMDVKDGTIEQVLREGLKNQTLDFYIQEKTIFIKRVASKNAIESTMGIEREVVPVVSGVVRSENGSPLMGATVYIRKIKRSGVTNAAGEFSIKNIPNGEYEIEVTYVGFEKFVTTITVTNQEARFSVLLKQSASDLDETVVKGYYNTTRRLNTGDVTTIKGEDIQKQPVTDPLLALEGRVPGLYIQQTSGIPGAYGNIHIMGQNSIANGNDPLYIIDGVPFSSQSLTSSVVGGGAAGYSSNTYNSGGGGLSPFNGLNPADIERIEVLKDADATAIYGSRGANGVILITTKKGKSGNSQFGLNVFTGISNVARTMNLLNTRQYLSLRREAYQNDGLAVPSIITNPKDNSYDIDGVWDTTRNTDWQKVLIENKASFTNLQGSLSGGNKNTQFMVGGGFSNQGLVYPGSFSDMKSSGHLSIVHASDDERFHMQVGASYVNDNNNLPITDLTSYISTAPDAPLIYDANGNVNWGAYNGSITFGGNPIAGTLKHIGAITNNLISNLSLSYMLFPGLQLKSQFGYNNDEMNQTEIVPASAYAPPNNNNPSYRSLYLASTRFKTWIIEPQVTYQRSFNWGQIDGLVGTTFQENNQYSLAESGSGFSSDALISNIAAASSVTINTPLLNTLYRYNAVYARIGYSWQERYLINLTARRDGSSRFGPGKQFGNFGAAGLGWVFSKEKILENHLGLLSFGKIRASYGVTGNDQIPDYQFLSTYSPLSSSYEGVTGFAPTQLSNPYFAWEVVRKLEGGLDIGLLKDRILFSGVYYRNRTANQLVGYALPYLTGFSTIYYNLPATVQNTGVELMLNTANFKSKNFTWSTAINVTVPSNKLVAFPDIANFPSYKTRYVVGKSLYIKELYHSTGVNPETGLYTFETKNSSGLPTNPQDLHVTRPVTQKYYGGMDNRFSYRSFELDIFIQYVNQLGYKYINNFASPGLTSDNEPVAVFGRWTHAGQLTDVQRFGTTSATYSLYNSYLRSSDAIITDASFLRVKNVAISYQVPGQWRSKLHASGMRIYLQCQNLFTVTRFLGLDPETGALNMPPLRAITGGLQVGF